MDDNLEARRPRCLERLNRTGIDLVDRLHEGAGQKAKALEEQREKPRELGLLEGEEQQKAPCHGRDVAQHGGACPDNELKRIAESRDARSDHGEDIGEDGGKRAGCDGVEYRHGKRAQDAVDLLECLLVREELRYKPDEPSGEVPRGIEEAEVDVTAGEQRDEDECGDDAQRGQLLSQKEMAVRGRSGVGCAASFAGSQHVH